MPPSTGERAFFDIEFDGVCAQELPIHGHVRVAVLPVKNGEEEGRVIRGRGADSLLVQLRDLVGDCAAELLLIKMRRPHEADRWQVPCVAV